MCVKRMRIASSNIPEFRSDSNPVILLGKQLPSTDRRSISNKIDMNRIDRERKASIRTNKELSFLNVL